MKKFLLSILSLIYMASTVGATVHVHYCMDKLADWSFSSADSKTCSSCGMEKKDTKGCCSEKKAEVKLKADQKPVASFQLTLLQAQAEPVPFFEIPATILLNSEKGLLPSVHAPPLAAGAPLYIRLRTIRI